MTTGAGAAGRLAGRTVVVTRAAEQAGELSELLRQEGAQVVEVAAIAVAEPGDGGAGLRVAAERLGSYAWVVVTSPNGARRLAAAAAEVGVGPARLAVVGPGTAAACTELGLSVDLVPERFVAEGLLAAFPRPTAATGPAATVLVAQAAAARPVLVDGLRAMGWEVDAVEAYRTVPAPAPPEVVERVRHADAVTFTSGSTVAGLLGAVDRAALPAVVACIGPVTAQALQAHGIGTPVVAEDHTSIGLVTAIVKYLRSRGEK